MLRYGQKTAMERFLPLLINKHLSSEELGGCLGYWPIE